MLLKGKLYFGIILLILVALIAGACAKEVEDEDKFEDTKWVLESYGEKGNLQSVLEGTEINATFESAEHQVRGSAGCNSYFGEYEVSGNQITISQIANTEMYCLDPEGVMEQEQEYLKILQTTDSYEIHDGKLQINSDGKVLVFSIK